MKYLSKLLKSKNEFIVTLGYYNELRIGTCEAYWLNSDSTKKLESESWSQYVLRSNEEVLSGFNTILSSVNFEFESNKFEFLKLEKQKGINISNYLIFVAYFVNQSEII